MILVQSLPLSFNKITQDARCSSSGMTIFDQDFQFHFNLYFSNRLYGDEETTELSPGVTLSHSIPVDNMGYKQQTERIQS